MNVPDDPRGVLGLIQEVERAVEETGGAGECAGGESVDGDGGVDGATGIARHAMTGGSPVLLHCSAGVGRTGGFIAVDAVLDAIRREMRTGCGEEKRHVGEEVGPVGVNAGTEAREGADIHAGSNVVHAPELSDVDGMITPMQVDNEGTGTGTGTSESEQEGDGETFRPATLTRRWAESVSDQTRTGLTMNLSASKGINGFAPPLPPPSSVASSSAFPSSIGSVSVSGSSMSGYSGSEDSFAFNRAYHSGASSLIGTSVSGGSVSSKSFQPPSLSQPHAANLELGASPDVDGRERKLESLPVLPGFTFGRTESEHRDRTRTFSAPAAAKSASSVDAVSKSHGLGPLRQGLGGIGIGSSPLANVSTPWLAGEDRKFSSPLPGAEPLTAGKPMMMRQSSNLSSDVEEKESVGGSIQTWNSNSRPISRSDSHSHPNSKWSPPPDSASSPVLRYTPDGLVDNTFRATTVDYKEPRALHGESSPLALSTCEEPIWEVVQDMREQRMSLCQSLRQYVFVHAAVIEGALMIVDDERERDASGVEKDAGLDAKTSSGAGTVHAVVPIAGGGGSKSAATPIRPLVTLHTSDSSTTSSTGKRGASPTELLKEGMKGEVLLSKRPSVKRLQQSGDRAAGAIQTASLLSLVANPVPPMPHFPKAQ